MMMARQVILLAALCVLGSKGGVWAATTTPTHTSITSTDAAIGSLVDAVYDWHDRVAITNLFSQGTLLFVTAGPGGAVTLSKSDVADSETQHFDLGPFWPSKAFTVQSRSSHLYLDLNGGAVIFKAPTGLPSQIWSYDVYGRLLSSGLCVDVVGAVVSQASLVAVDCSSSLSQEWIFHTSAPPPDVFEGYIYSIEAEGNLQCLDTNVGRPLTAGVKNALGKPTMAPCDGSAGQKIIARPSNPSDRAAGHFPNGAFTLEFAKTALCVAVYAPFFGEATGRDAIQLVQTSCPRRAATAGAAGGRSTASLTADDGDAFFTKFTWNARGQLQSELAIDDVTSFTYRPVCLSTNGSPDGAQASGCSYKTLANRWLWSYTAPSSSTTATTTASTAASSTASSTASPAAPSTASLAAASTTTSATATPK